jgi:hypothetical protein
MQSVKHSTIQYRDNLKLHNNNDKSHAYKTVYISRRM